MRLYHMNGPKAGQPCEKGDELTDFRGDPAVYVDCYPPRNPASTGRVKVEAHGYHHEFYPNVYNLVWGD